jgi:beta-N-acetylhexosaminidase
MPADRNVRRVEESLMTNSSRRKPILILALASSLAASCAPPSPPQVGLSLASDGARWVEKMMRTMTLEDKVAQMIGCRYSGDFLAADSDQLAYLKRLVTKHKIGSLAIFLGEAYETAILNNALQAVADVPLLMGSDLERGAGNQITGATLFPTIMGLGASGSEELAYAMGRTTALEGRAVGLHMTYAPVVDVNINPDNPIINTGCLCPRLPGRRHDRHGQALSRPRRHRPGLAHSASRHQG